MSQLTDLSFLKTFTAGDPTKMSKYINMFLGMAPKSILQMRKEVEGADWKSLKTSAHSLKTQLKYMGAASAVDLAYSIEQKCGEMSGLENVPDLMNKLEEQTNTTITELKDALTKI